MKCQISPLLNTYHHKDTHTYMCTNIHTQKTKHRTDVHTGDKTQGRRPHRRQDTGKTSTQETRHREDVHTGDRTHGRRLHRRQDTGKTSTQETRHREDVHTGDKTQGRRPHRKENTWKTSTQATKQGRYKTGVETGAAVAREIAYM